MQSRYGVATMKRDAEGDPADEQNVPTHCSLIAKWKRQGYEKLCCVRCIQSRDMNNVGSTCICRVPKSALKPGTVVECPHCGELFVCHLRKPEKC